MMMIQVGGICGGILGMQVTVVMYQLGAGGLYVLDCGDQVDCILDQSMPIRYSIYALLSPHSCYYGCFILLLL